MFQPTNTLLLAILNILTAAAARLDGALIMLYTAGPAPSKTSLLSQYTEANYTGYARVDVQDTVWRAAELEDGSKPIIRGDSIEFRPTDAVVSNTIRGYLMLNVAGTAIEGGEQFDEPVLLNSALTAVSVVPTIGFDPDANYGSATVLH